ncbi:hypothetical protein [Nocardioides sp. SYSU D00038]|uniref:glycosyl hydrolase 2 galactose-binding domain-containing protein n=1 Tax=Nocardioides sp. SYSU D00038 TaxID=2812554 RepID=UPI0019678EF9|nr:hypothetical protein [Nocardioides sp. SYSU D00038]
MRRVLAFDGPTTGADDAGHEQVARVDVDDPAGAALEVHGVATSYDVLVNGGVVLTGRSMFERHVVDVSGALRPGSNEVVVRVHPLTDLLGEQPRRPRARWRTMLTDEPRLRWVRTSVLGRAPGFAPRPPRVGPHLPVVLATGPRVTSLRLVPSLRGSTGVLDVEVEANVPELVVEVSPGPTPGSAPGSASGSAPVSAPVVDGRARLELPDVRRWWPHTHGEPHTYAVRVLHGGRPLSLPGDRAAAERRVGFRTLANAAPSALALVVNDVPVFVRGAVWTPGDLAALDEAVALGLNLVRVSGISAYESDAFHARCDELGLLVWQDLMFTTFDYPLADEGFAATVRAEAADQCGRLVGHPSTAVVCGSAEHEQQAALFGVRPDTGAAAELAALTRPVVAASGLDAVWVDSSPSGGDLPVRVDTGVAQYFGVGAYRRDLPDARHSGVRFAAECLAFASLPDPLPPGGEDVGVPRDSGADWDFADVREHYARRRYGPDATLEQRQRVTGEVMADVLGEWRRPASPCAGGIVLWLRDLEPGAGWGLLDHTGRPKPAALALAPVLQPTAVWLVDEGLNGVDVHVANDRPEAVVATLAVELLRADGSAADSASEAVVVPPHGHLRRTVDTMLGRWADSAYAYRFGSPQHAAVRATLTGADGTVREATWRVTTPARA